MAVDADGFVIPVPKEHLAAYKRMSRRAGRVWKELGALEYRDALDARVMKDPRIQKMMRGPMPFDAKRMGRGGFECRGDL